MNDAGLARGPGGPRGPGSPSRGPRGLEWVASVEASAVVSEAMIGARAMAVGLVEARGTGIVSAPVPKKLLLMAGIDDCCTSVRGYTATLGNFTKATFDAISKTYSYLTPHLWKETVFTKSPYQEFTDHLVKTQAEPL
ncbi:Hypothetical predicted protein [Marmota monax]|uniref:Small ribosomal subunit protein uS5 n=1 Tax=Marmota monax TaxID=9995 RepID=A0A5E4B2S3_MARMO|nr:Hypothetical predicted protein [Marmota monax]